MAGIGFGSDKSGKKKPGRKKGPTARTRLYAQLLIKSKGKLSKKAAALAAGFSESMADNVKVKIEDVHREFFQRLADAAIPDEILIAKLREGLDATEVKTASYEGKITAMEEFVDFKTRLAYLETAAEWKGRVSRRGVAGKTEINLPITLISSIPRPPRGGNDDDNGGDKTPVLAG